MARMDYMMRECRPLDAQSGRSRCAARGHPLSGMLHQRAIGLHEPVRQCRFYLVGASLRRPASSMSLVPNLSLSPSAQTVRP